MRAISLEKKESVLWHGARECNNLIAFENGVLVNLHTFAHQLHQFYIIGTHPSLPPERSCHFDYDSGTLTVIDVKKDGDKEVERVYRVLHFGTASTVHSVDLSYLFGSESLPSSFSTVDWSLKLQLPEGFQNLKVRLNENLLSLSPMPLEVLSTLQATPLVVQDFAQEFLFGKPGEAGRREQTNEERLSFLKKLVSWIVILQHLQQSAPNNGAVSDYLGRLEYFFHNQCAHLASPKDLHYLIRGILPHILPGNTTLPKNLAFYFLYKSGWKDYYTAHVQTLRWRSSIRPRSPPLMRPSRPALHTLPLLLS